MVIVTIPWWLGLAYLPLLLTYRVTLIACVLALRLAAATARHLRRHRSLRGC